MFSPSNLFKSRSQRYTNGEIISVQKHVPSLVQVKIRTDTLGFVAKEKQTTKRMGATLQTIAMIEEGWITYGSASICDFNWCEYIDLLVDIYPRRSSFVQHPQQKLCRNPSNKLSYYAWFHSHINTHCSPYRFFGAAWSILFEKTVCSLRRSWL